MDRLCPKMLRRRSLSRFFVAALWLLPFLFLENHRAPIANAFAVPFRLRQSLRTGTPTTLNVETAFLAEACQPLVSLVGVATSSYGRSLVENPLPTKSITAGFLCGISDVIAQKRDSNLSVYNLPRTLRFASKGCLGGILWMYWYDWIDGFLQFELAADTTSSVTATTTTSAVSSSSAAGSVSALELDLETTTDSLSMSSIAETSTRVSFYVLAGAVLPPDLKSSFLAFSKDHIGALTTGLSITMEQFLWCPLVYGTFEIPISTVMNGGKPASIKNEVDQKLNGLLVSNAKVWTLANLVIYNAPIEWRLFIANVIDIFWQSIVSDVAADCGGDGEEECPIPFENEISSFREETKNRPQVTTLAAVGESKTSNSTDW